MREIYWTFIIDRFDGACGEKYLFSSLLHCRLRYLRMSAFLLLFLTAMLWTWFCVKTNWKLFCPEVWRNEMKNEDVKKRQWVFPCKITVEGILLFYFLTINKILRMGFQKTISGGLKIFLWWHFWCRKIFFCLEWKVSWQEKKCHLNIFPLSAKFYVTHFERSLRWCIK